MDGLTDHRKNVLWDNNFKLGASVVASAASKFGEWIQAGTDVSTPHRKYQVMSQISPWFSAACALTM